MADTLRPKLVIVFPHARVDLASATEEDLKNWFHDPQPYLAVKSGERPLSYLLEERGPMGYAPIRPDRLNLDPASGSGAPSELYRLYVLDDLLLRNAFSGRFGIRPDEEAGEPSKKAHAEVALRDDGENQAVEAITARSRKLKAKNQRLDNALLVQTVEDVGTIGRIAGRHGTVFHEPHHDLTPGMLLTDELFRRIVADVGTLLAECIGESQEKSVGLLQQYVAGLLGDPNLGPKGAARDLGAPYARFIDHTQPKRPTRIELIVVGDRVVAASIIVGAWRGGTHSDGSTIHR